MFGGSGAVGGATVREYAAAHFPTAMAGAGGALGTAMTTAELAEVTAFLASDHARVLTGTVLNASGGAVVD